MRDDMIMRNGREAPSRVFWGEITPCEHFVQMYSDEGGFLDTLEAFVRGGIESGEAVIIIATPDHRRNLEGRLWANGVDLQRAIARDQYIACDAQETLARFIIRRNDESQTAWPDDDKFTDIVQQLLMRARWGGPAAACPADGRGVRAFGEMVALLWKDGHSAATVRLEHLWHRLCQEKMFSLFCAYPRIGFTQSDSSSAMREICDAHSRVLAG